MKGEQDHRTVQGMWQILCIFNATMPRIVITLLPVILLLPAVTFWSEGRAQEPVAGTAAIKSRTGIIDQIRQIRIDASFYPDSVRGTALQTIQAARTLRDDSLVMEASLAYCLALQNLALFDSALWYTRQAGKIIFQYGYAGKYDHYYNFMARYHRHLNNYDSAMHYLYVLDDHLDKNGKQAKRWVSQQQLAWLFQDLEDYGRANAHMEQAIASARLGKVPMDYLFVLYSAIDLYAGQDSLSRLSSLTEEYLRFKLEMGVNILDTSQHLLLFLPGMDSNEGMDQVKRLLQVQLANRDDLAAINSYYALGTAYLQKGRDAEAIEAYENAVDLAYKLSYPNLRYNMHAAAFFVYDKIQNYPKALHHHKAMAALKDSMRNAEREKQMHELEVRYETAEKERDLADATYRLENVKRTRQLYGFAGLALLLVSAFSISAYRQKRRSARELAAKNAIISKALEEKDILLREIHHRVKNNLQMISALLYLHGKSVSDSSAQQALLESQNRVQSMAMIHQNLYHGDNLLGVPVKEYLDKLLNHLTASYNIEKDRIRISTQVEIDHLDVDTIIPLALIINELISNSLKYAFRDGRNGLIEVVVCKDNSEIRVVVRDDGLGLPEGFSIESDSHFGYQLIRILAERLRASLTTHSQNGTTVSLNIPLKKTA